MHNTVKIVFKGVLAPGKTQEQVAPHLAQTFKISPNQVDRLFSGAAVILKRQLPRADWPKYAAGLFKLGIVVEMAEEESLPPPADEILIFPSLLGGAIPPTPAPAPEVTPSAQLATIQETMSCPQCGTQQAKRTLCRECGVDMPRYQAAQMASTPTPPIHSRVDPDTDPSDGAEFTPDFRDISFEGRLGRIRYMSYSLGAMLIFAVIFGLFMALGLIRNYVGIGFFGLLLLFFMVRLTTLRLHDMERSGWWQLLAIPIGALQGYGASKLAAGGSSLLFNFANILFFLFSIWLLAWPGSRKDNEFGFPNERNTAFGYIGAALLLIAGFAGGFGAKEGRLDEVMPGRESQQARQLVVLYCSNSNTCQEARNWFARHPKLPYTDCNLDEQPSCRADFKRMGNLSVPLLVVGNKKHEGFDPDWLMAEVGAEMLRRAQEARDDE